LYIAFCGNVRRHIGATGHRQVLATKGNDVSLVFPGEVERMPERLNLTALAGEFRIQNPESRIEKVIIPLQEASLKETPGMAEKPS